MNILLLNVAFGRGWGGIESHSDILGAELARRGHTITMGCGSEGSVKVTGGISLPSKKIWIRNSGDIRAVIKIIRICRSKNIDVIIANGGHEYWPSALAAMFLGVKMLFVRHQTDPIRKTTRWLINNHVDAVVAVSGAVMQALIRSGIRANKIALIHNSVSLEKFDPSGIDREAIRNELGIDSNEFLIGTTGKLNRGKGVYELLRATGMISGGNRAIKLVFAGDGEEREGLGKEAERLGMRDKVIFTGVRKDVERIYAAMDVFVLPSTCEEAFGMVLIEAMAMGKPVIGTMVGGIPELISDGKNGTLVPPGNEKALARAIQDYLTDKDLSTRVAAAGRRTVEAEFSDRTLGDRFEEVLKELEAR
ncbi:MAG: glycosyltransferase family 4 protein [Thermodesulfovibrionales bacterium]